MAERGFVYVVKPENSNRCKIGWTSRHPETRLSELQTSHHRKLVLEGVIPADESMEKRIHDHFSERRIRGEWFEVPTDKIRDILDRGWRRRVGIQNPDDRPAKPWEKAGVETEEDWDMWAEAGFPVDGWDDPIIPDT